MSKNKFLHNQKVILIDSLILDIKAKAIITEYAELGCDIDNEEHLGKIIKYIEK